MPPSERSVRELTTEIASESVAPAGGTGAAVSGAVGASLCEMACVHTGDDAAVELSDAGDALRTVRTRLLELADRDAEVIEESFASGEDVGTAGAKRALGVAIATAEACLVVLETGERMLRQCNENALPDAMTGLRLAHSALEASASIARANTALSVAPDSVRQTEERLTELERSADRAFERAAEANSRRSR